MTNLGCTGPAPSGSHMVAARTMPFVPGKPEPGSHCVAHWAAAFSDSELVTREKSRTATAAEDGSAGEGREIMEHPRGWRTSERCDDTARPFACPAAVRLALFRSERAFVPQHGSALSPHPRGGVKSDALQRGDRAARRRWPRPSPRCRAARCGKR